MSQLELISFNLCPFVQRSVITLNMKNVAHGIKYIDLANKPDWFLKISPLGKVPVLRLEDTVLFESAVINEYLDETNGPSMHPADPLPRAQNRAWIEFGSGLLGSQFSLTFSPDVMIWSTRWVETSAKLKLVEEQLGEGPYFNGANFSLVDAAFAPAFMRFAIIEKHTFISFFQKMPKLTAWSKALLQLEQVKKSVLPNFEELYLAYIKEKGDHMAKLFAEAGPRG